MGVRPKTGGKKHDRLKYQPLLPFSLASSPKTYRGEGHPVSAVVQLGAGAKSFHLPSRAVSALHSSSAGLRSAVQGYLSVHTIMSTLRTSK